MFAVPPPPPARVDNCVGNGKADGSSHAPGSRVVAAGAAWLHMRHQPLFSLGSALLLPRFPPSKNFAPSTLLAPLFFPGTAHLFPSHPSRSSSSTFSLYAATSASTDCRFNCSSKYILSLLASALVPHLQRNTPKQPRLLHPRKEAPIACLWATVRSNLGLTNMLLTENRRFPRDPNKFPTVQLLFLGMRVCFLFSIIFMPVPRVAGLAHATLKIPTPTHLSTSQPFASDIQC